MIIGSAICVNLEPTLALSARKLKKTGIEPKELSKPISFLVTGLASQVLRTMVMSSVSFPWWAQ
eukprot:4695969-Amphidinium_carterae.1